MEENQKQSIPRKSKEQKEEEIIDKNIIKDPEKEVLPEEEEGEEDECPKPLVLMDVCVNQSVYVLMEDNKEMVGTMQSFDDCMNLILSDVTIYDYEDGNSSPSKKVVKNLLLNGNHLLAIVPGSKGPENHEVKSVDE